MDSLPELAGARVLVTGGHGFIGGAVVRLLDAVGAQVRCPYRPGHSMVAALPGDHLAVDLRDAPRLAEAMAGIDLVVHLAARSGGIQFQQAAHAEVFAENHRLTHTVLQVASRVGVRRVFLASSAVVYRPQAPQVAAALHETAPLITPAEGPVSGYAWSKLTDEVLGSWYARTGALEVVAGRFGNVYGPGGSFDRARSTVVHALVRRAVEAVPSGSLVVWGDGTPVRSFVYVDDAARGALTVLTRAASGEVCNIDSGRPITIRDLAVTVRDIVAPTIALEFDLSKPRGLPQRVLDIAQLSGLGFVPKVPLDQGIRTTVQRYVSGRTP